MANPIQTVTGKVVSDTLTLSLTTPTVGNLIVICVWGFASGAQSPTASDTGSNTYTLDSNIGGSGSVNCSIQHAKVTSAAGSPFQVTYSLNDGGTGAPRQVQMTVFELGSMNATTQPDVATTGTTASTASIQPGSQTPTVTGDFGVLVFGANDSSAGLTWTDPAGWTSANIWQNGSTNQPGECLWQTISGTGAQNPTISNFSDLGATLGLTMGLFRPTGGAAARQQSLSMLGVGT
jgi:hypothetical protein